MGEPMLELDEVTTGVIRRRFGGDALNVAVHLKREDPDVAVQLLTAVGDDRFSAELLEYGTTEGIDMSGVDVVRGGVVGAYMITTDASGERSFTYWRSGSPARSMLSGERPLHLPSPDLVDTLMISGITLAVLDDVGRSALSEYAEAARRNGTTVVYDPNHRASLWSVSEAYGSLQRMCAAAAVVLASLDDGIALQGADDQRSFAGHLRALGASEAVVTAGSAPTAASWADQQVMIETVRVEHVVDTTGAGDSFDAAYVAARLGGDDPVTAITAGHRRAAMTIGHRGAIMERTHR
ncbi:MAG: sugar kinase [Ilumatobacteraceae bacterium]